MLASSWASLVHFRAMLGHVGAKMANKSGKMPTKNAKVSQDGPTWAAKANEVCNRRALPGHFCGRSNPLELLNLQKEKDQRGRQDLAKNLQII